MTRKGKSITLSVSERDKAELETLALEYGLTWGDRPNISKLVEAIARKRLTIAPNHDWNSARINSLNQARNTLIDAGQIDDAVAIAHLLLERSELTIPLRQELEQFIDNPALPWRLEIERYIKQQQSFQLSYQDATERLWQFTVRYAEIASHGNRQYLDCWCEETQGNQDLPELRHNWCLRLDRITDAAIAPIPGKWYGHLDSIDVEIHLYGRLAFAYESKTTNDVVNRWWPDAPQTRQLVRRVSNTFWLIRELLPYGQDCEVISPEKVKEEIKQEVQAMAKRYECSNQHS